MSQRQIPGGVLLNESGTQQSQVPGGSFVNGSTGAFSMPAAVGSFALTGIDFTGIPDAAQSLDADTALPFVLTGFAVGLSRGYIITAAQGSFALEVAPSLSDFQVTSEYGNFSLTGNDVVFAHGYLLTAESGPFVLTGNEVTFDAPEHTNPPLQAETGSFSLAGQDATLIRLTNSMEAESGTFTLDGYPIVGATVFSVDAGEFVLTGGAATFTIGGGNPGWARRAEVSTTWTRR
jgi:hypothetical protein